MPTPKEGYWMDGVKRVVSVTTVLFPYSPGGSDALIGWAINLLFDEIEKRLPITSMEQLADCKRLHIAARNNAGEIGTMAHAAIEWWAQGGTYAFTGPPEIVEPAKMAYGAFIKWAGRTNFRITDVEVRLISKKYQYGGTLDASGVLNNLRGLLDWKTSNYVKETMVMQLAAYRNLWNENYPDDPVLGDCNLIRFDKKTGTFVDHWFPGEILDEAFKDFLRLREVYDNIKKYRI